MILFITPTAFEVFSPSCTTFNSTICRSRPSFAPCCLAMKAKVLLYGLKPTTDSWQYRQDFRDVIHIGQQESEGTVLETLTMPSYVNEDSLFYSGDLFGERENADEFWTVKGQEDSDDSDGDAAEDAKLAPSQWSGRARSGARHLACAQGKIPCLYVAAVCQLLYAPARAATLAALPDWRAVECNFTRVLFPRGASLPFLSYRHLDVTSLHLDDAQGRVLLLCAGRANAFHVA
jgi:hypothetical protein